MRFAAKLAAFATFALAACSQPTTLAGPPQTGPSIEQARADAYNGPKARIAVSEFEDKMSSTSQYRAEYGRGMADMLSDALFSTNRYIVLEREKIQAVMAEQNLGASGRVKKETAAQIGELEGAELLVTAAITGFDPSQSGGGAVLGGLLPTRWQSLGQIAGGISQAYVAADVRLIDTSTGRSAHVNGSATNFGGIGSVIGSSIGTGLTGFSHTPMESAIRDMIQQAVNFVVTRTPASYYHPMRAQQ